MEIGRYVGYVRNISKHTPPCYHYLKGENNIIDSIFYCTIILILNPNPIIIKFNIISEFDSTKCQDFEPLSKT